jgi:hypothetical protein
VAALKVAEFLASLDVKLSKSRLSRSAATRRHPAGVRTRVRTPCSTPFALHLGAIRGRMPRRHVSAQRLIACVPRRNRPPTRLRARILAYIGTVQPAVGQTIGRAAQIQRLPTPSRALCLQTHQTRPCPRNHRPGRVRTWSRLESGRTTAGWLTSPTSPPALRAAVGIHSFATRQIGSARCCALQLPRYTASRSSWQLVCMCCRARMACASRLLCDNRSRRRQAPTLGVLPGCRAQLISPQACITPARDPPTDPRRSLFLA